MQRYRALTVAALLAAGIAGCGVGEETGEVVQQVVDQGLDAAALAQLVVDYETAFNAEDAYAYSQLYTVDAVRMPPGEPATVGRDSIAIIAKEAWFNVGLQVDLTVDETILAGEWAIIRGAVAATKTMKVTGKSSDAAFKFLWVAQKQADGSWKIARQMWNPNR